MLEESGKQRWVTGTFLNVPFCYRNRVFGLAQLTTDALSIAEMAPGTTSEIGKPRRAAGFLGRANFRNHAGERSQSHHLICIFISGGMAAFTQQLYQARICKASIRSHQIFLVIYGHGFQLIEQNFRCNLRSAPYGKEIVQGTFCPGKRGAVVIAALGCDVRA